MQTLALLLWAAACALQDATQKRISNWLTLGGLLLALIYLLVNTETLTGATPAQAAMAFGVAVLLTLPGYVLGKLGAGDVKMLAALAVASDVLHTLCSIAGAGLLYLAWHLVSTQVWLFFGDRPLRWLKHFSPEHSAGWPYAPFVLASLLVTIFWLS